MAAAVNDHSSPSPPPPYIPAIVDNSYILAFIDSGSFISLMSADFYYSIPESQRSILQKSTTLASTITREGIDIIGTTSPTIHLGNKTTRHMFNVARNITHPFVLGWDFMFKHDATLSTTTFTMPGMSIPLVDRRQYQVPLKCNVSLIGKATLPGMSEVHVQGRLIPPQPDVIPQDYDGIFEPSIHEHLHVAGARSLSRPQDGIDLTQADQPFI